MTTFSFNLWNEPWVRLTRPDGTSVELSIYDCLTNAHELIALSDPSPLVAAGTHRLLAAILQFIYQPQDLTDLETLIQENQFDEPRLNDFGMRFAHRFDLFELTEPFLQTGDVSLADIAQKPEALSPISRLFAEVPTETNRTLFEHVTDDSHTVCPACCARGIITIPSFTSSGGPGLRPSINGVPPVYILPTGQFLFVSLVLSLLTSEKQPRKAAAAIRGEIAPWNWTATISRNEQVTAVGYIESLLFPARRLRLLPVSGSVRCTSCGKPTETYVSRMLFEMGRWLDTKDIGPWDDPFIAFQDSNKKDQPASAIRPKEGKALWREFNGLFLVETERKNRPKVITQIKDLADNGGIQIGSAVQVRCVWLRTDGKAKILEWGDESLDAPIALLRNPSGELHVSTALAHAEDIRQQLYKNFGFHVAKTAGQKVSDRERFHKLRDRMQADYWQALAAPFRSFIVQLADVLEEDDERHIVVLDAWDDTLIRVGKNTFDAAVDQFGSSAEAIRARVISKDSCRRALNFQKRRWYGTNNR